MKDQHLLPLTATLGSCPNCITETLYIKDMPDGRAFVTCESCGENIRPVLSRDELMQIGKAREDKRSRWQIFKIRWTEFWECTGDIYFLERREKGLANTPEPSPTPCAQPQYYNLKTREWQDAVNGLYYAGFWSSLLFVLMFKWADRTEKKYDFSLIPVADALFITEVFGAPAPATKEDVR